MCVLQRVVGYGQEGCALGESCFYGIFECSMFSCSRQCVSNFPQFIVVCGCMVAFAPRQVRFSALVCMLLRDIQ